MNPHQLPYYCYQPTYNYNPYLIPPQHHYRLPPTEIFRQRLPSVQAQPPTSTSVYSSQSVQHVDGHLIIDACDYQSSSQQGRVQEPTPTSMHRSSSQHGLPMGLPIPPSSTSISQSQSLRYIFVVDDQYVTYRPPSHHGLSNVHVDSEVAIVDDLNMDQTDDLPVSTGFTATQLSDLPLTKYCKDEEGVDCAICICELEENEMVPVLACKHKFHENCIKQWLERQNLCPLCKCIAV
ncbi:Zinc finger, RING/FYVE/PHD-type [Artemisia annua]|uniref:Zinc finger, RING/FYVE/PHD-type n=1 Tax=Artemisia annua TaxID=35608 RepID=A0A2U1MKN1_ARTAN|nr:Zinc finger, RING/FYVE/PHD-type [Artemisia annua]